MIYFDNAATSFPKPEFVYTEIERCLREYCANPGRGGHRMSIESGKIVFEARENLSRFFNISDPTRISFTKNATEGLNYAIKGVLDKGDHVITTSMEHNSVIRPLKELEREAVINLTIINGNKFGEINLKDLKHEIKANTKLIVTTLSSNVNGIIMPVKEIGKIARENKIIYLLDASQGAGIIDIDVDEMSIDLMAFPGHKCLLGPQGIGGVYVSKKVNLISTIQGGTGTDSINFYQPEYMPELLESGTLNTPGIAGLNAGIKFINLIGKEKIRNHKFRLVKHFIDGIADIKGVEIYSKNEFKNNSGIVAFKFEKIESSEIAYVFDKVYNVAVRSGLHCSPLAHKTLDTLEKGLVRISVGYFNNMDEITKLINIIKEIKKHISL